ncbi:MAG: hypothetical protein AAFP19_02340 [Bacteroidota bacterium]
MKSLTLLFVFTLASLNLFAQNDAQIVEAQLKMSQGENNAYTLLIKDSNAKELEKSWSKFMKRYKGKTKKDKKSGEYFTDNATIKEMSSNTVDVYARFNQEGKNTELTLWYDLGGAYLSSDRHEDKSPMANKMLNQFNNEVVKNSIKVTLAGQEKVLKSLNGDMKNLEKQQNSLEDEIAKCEKKIEEAKKKLAQNAKDQSAKAGEIKAQQTTVKGTQTLLKKYN